MNIEDVRAFVAVVDTGSIGKAAIRLNLTQPAISRRLQRLEESLGIGLLDRDSKPARVTRAGDAAYRRCVAVLQATETLQRETRGAAAAGPLRLGVSYAVADSVLAPALDALRSQCPEFALHLTTDRSPALRKQAEDGQIDAAVVGMFPGRPIEGSRATLLGTERVMIVANRDFAPAARRLSDIADAPWVINPDGCGFRSQLDKALAGSGHVLNVMAETWGIPLQLALLARGGALGLVPERLLAESPYRDRLRALRLEDFEPELSVWLVRSGPAGPFDQAIGIFADTVRARLVGGRGESLVGRVPAESS
jgi:DNA-binding transcriptional LysR family regulator